jgi:hypothetical protein
MKAIYSGVTRFAVNVTGKHNGFVPRDHKNWIGWGIDKLEEDGLIEDFPITVVVPPTQEEIRDKELAEAKSLRDTSRYEVITVGGNVFDATPLAYTNITGSLLSWDALMLSPDLLASGAVTGSTMAWTLADNTMVYVTKDMLQALADTLAVRSAVLHVDYTEAKK